jgi:hypothetical protein
MSLRGWLSDVYVPALIEGSLEPLLQRLGARATIEDPILGRAVGLASIEAHLAKCAAWLKSLDAKYERGQFTTGVDRDVTEGLLTATTNRRSFEVPIAVVAERRRSREVEVRVYYSAHALGAVAQRAALTAQESSVVLPALVAEHQAALRRGDVQAALACFEEKSVARDAGGAAFGKTEGTLGALHERLAMGGWEAQLGGYADDGRTCALEHTLVRVGGKDVAPQAALMVYERGDSGLFRALRMYDDLAA